MNFREKSMKDLLTNETLRSSFKNNFDLAHFAIELGRYYIHSGHEISLTHLLDEVRKNPSEKFLQELRQLDQEEATI